jgi:hypothetical protein
MEYGMKENIIILLVSVVAVYIGKYICDYAYLYPVYNADGSVSYVKRTIFIPLCKKLFNHESPRIEAINYKAYAVKEEL